MWCRMRLRPAAAAVKRRGDLMFKELKKATRIRVHTEERVWKNITE